MRICIIDLVGVSLRQLFVYNCELGRHKARLGAFSRSAIEFSGLFEEAKEDEIVLNRESLVQSLELLQAAMCA